jgi:hypothetical protein
MDLALPADWRSCGPGKYCWFGNPPINGSIYFSRKFSLKQPTEANPLSPWITDNNKWAVVDVVTKDGSNKFFKLVEVGRVRGRGNVVIDKSKYIPCEQLALSDAIEWDCYKNQSGKGTFFNGRALVGRVVKKESEAGFLEGSITECRELDQEQYVYTVEFYVRNKPTCEHWNEKEVLERLCM